MPQPFPRASDSSSMFTIAHRTRCPRGPPTNWPVRYRIMCCTHSSALTFRGRCSYMSPMPIGNSRGNAFTNRPWL